MDEGWSLANPAQQWRQVATEAHALANQFARRAGELIETSADPLTAEPFLEALALAGATRVAARLAAGDDLVARQAADQTAQELVALGQHVRLGELTLAAMRAGTAEPGSAELGELLDSTADALRPAVAAVREREAAVAATMLTLAELEKQKIKGRAWLEAARSEQIAPLLCLLPQDA
jgi:hypothetical protein